MITTALLNVIYVFVVAVVSLLRGFGEVDESNAITSAITAIQPYYVSLETIFPVGTVLAIVGFVLVFEGLYLLYKLIKWSYTKIPGIN
jgi:hypothetical protein